jgi:protein-S-isoprenylcysteine O-methyltransferase Ste14
MSVSFEFWPTLTFTVVFLSWLAFVAVFFAGKKSASVPERKRELKSIVGIVFQAASYAIVWTFYRLPFTSLWPTSKPMEIAIASLTIVLTLSSVLFFNAAIRTLGKQWSLAARVLEEHTLITEGPYSIVRNPIYTAMLGMLIATGLAISRWWAMVLATALFIMGTTIRVRSEERLLRNAFGREFDNYARQVPALIPFVL